MPNRSPLLPWLLRTGHRVQRLWWRVRRPRTFGVQVLLRHPARSGRVLAVRHSYADPERWTLPGGGYRPRRESAQDAARREVREELGLEVTGTLAVLTTHTVTTSGKRDTVTVLTGTAASADAHLSYELRDARWIRPDLTDLAGEPTSQWLRTALEHAPERPPIVCLCGSSRFREAFAQANYALTLAGQIVLSIGVPTHAADGEGVSQTSAAKIALDELHKRKIDLADWVYVLDVDGYIGESTRSEISYAEQHGKPVRYLSQHPLDLPL